ncbi:hypothetical protein ABID16_001889 [Rhizobium aquaticum]|uniref:NERD domain-containing protein n=1 Tax=Rhizobium aquaticum TaxID=1549636 RepID=A0ABV2IYH1_9HYPH
MTIFESAFRKRVSGLKSPSSAEYSQSLWDSAYANVHPTLDDTNLYQSAKWIAAEFAFAREVFKSPSFGPLSPEWATILAIASLNREYLTAIQLRDEKANEIKKTQSVSFDAHLEIRIEGPGGQHFTIDDYVESATDLTESWLFDAFKASGPNPPPQELSVYAVEAGVSYSFRKAMNSLWNQVWHEGWYCELSPDSSFNWKPADPSARVLNQTWLKRQQRNLLNYAHIDSTVWPALTPSERKKRSRQWAVTSVRRVSGKVKIKVSSPSYISRKLPIYTIEKGAIEYSYLYEFFDTEMPKQKGVTAAKLLSAWHLLVDIANGLKQGVALPTTLSPEQARMLALEVPAAALCKAIEDGLNVDSATSAAIIDFLTFEIKTGKNQKGHRGLWSAPLVRVPQCNDYVLPLPALMTSNPLRKMEAWLEKGGIDDSNPITARGERYEASYRKKIKESVAANKKFSSASFAEHGVKKTKNFSEQIDLLVSFGGLCLVGEIKLFLMPADPSERARYDKKLEAAALQTKRKLEILKTRPDVTAATLGISAGNAEKLRYLPIVVTAQDYGFSTKVRDVLIVEAGFLEMFLSGNEIVVGRTMQRGGRRAANHEIEYYRNELEAADRFEEEASSPYVLKRILERYSWGRTPFPSLAHANVTLAVPIYKDGSDL